MTQYTKKNVFDVLSDEQMEELENYSKKYMDFLSTAKTERLGVKEAVRLAEEKGFRPFEVGMDVKAGDKVYALNHDKAIALFILGEDLTEGMHIVGAHLDAPRLDLKANPLYEKSNMAYLRTHYYGGIKKYQWATIPLALHGVIFTKEGERVEIAIGEDPSDPVFYITDLLPHLAREQMKKDASEVITGEQLQLVAGSSSRGQEGEDAIKKNLLGILKEKYGLVEEDFQVAELQAVPQGAAREVGFDRSLIMGYGHDDRVCSFAALEALLETEKPVKKTAVALLVDKEEIGSVGNTGMHSQFFPNLVAELLNATKETYSELDLKRALANTKVLSADVNAALDPNFAQVSDEQNSAKMGCGVTVAKYTGSGGKGGSNDANPEFLQELRKVFDDAGVNWQTGELGAVDVGGGGTIAYILAHYGAQVVDCGVGMLSMHAPMELVSKADAFETFRAYRAFFGAE